MNSKRVRVIGLMSGTSIDGVDVALVEVIPKYPVPQIFLKAFQTLPFHSTVRKAILAACSHEPLKVDTICELNFVLGEVFAQAVIHFARSHHIPLISIDLIGSHGQTIRHLPPSGRKNKAMGSTFQIGEPAVIAEKTGITTVADFRPSDMAAGGHGAPLAPYLHYCLFHSLGYGMGVQNIGGIGNLTFIKKNATLADVIAFDTGPGNVLIDSVISMMTRGKRTFDIEGKLAAQGKVQIGFLKKLLVHPYFKKEFPKSTGRELFGCSDAQRIVRGTRSMKKEDLIATLTAFTAHSIAMACRPFLDGRMKELVIGGGGVKNKTLFYMIQELLPSVQIKRFEDYHLNSDAIEAMAFALLAYETFCGRPSNIPKTTGASHPKVLGKIIPGNNFKSFSLN